MIDTLRHVMERVELLPPEEQAMLVAQFQRALEEVEAEHGWRERFNDPCALDALDLLIDEAIVEDEAGETIDLDEVLLFRAL